MDTELTKEYTLFNLSANQRSHPFTVIVNVDGQDLTMEIVAKQATATQYS